MLWALSFYFFLLSVSIWNVYFSIPPLHRISIKSVLEVKGIYPLFTWTSLCNFACDARAAPLLLLKHSSLCMHWPKCPGPLGRPGAGNRAEVPAPPHTPRAPVLLGNLFRLKGGGTGVVAPAFGFRTLLWAAFQLVLVLIPDFKQVSNWFAISVFKNMLNMFKLSLVETSTEVVLLI